MPIYLYQHPTKNIVKQIYQNMNQPHEYSEDGVKWNRVFEVPQASTGATIGNIDPFDENAWMRKTGEMRNITQGDMWDLSKEMSEKRTKIAGKDAIKEKTCNDYKKKTKKEHPLKDL